MVVRALASSSKGNAYLVEQDGAAVLVDCGVSCRCLRAACDLTRLCGVLVTHNHTDHVSGLKRLLNAVDVPVFANAMTAEAVAHEYGIDDSAFRCFENGQAFEVGPFLVHPFSVPHDTVDPVGFLIRGDETYFHGTDIGTPLASVGLKLAEADIATLESNHDREMLRRSGRPPSVVQRIAGPRGHLSNAEAAELVRQYASPRLRELRLAHLSRDCNLPYLAEREMRQALKEIGRSDMLLEILPSIVEG